MRISRYCSAWVLFFIVIDTAKICYVPVCSQAGLQVWIVSRQYIFPAIFMIRLH